MSARGLLIGAGLLGALAIVSGAFGAHALAASLSLERLEVWRTAASYELAHALAVLALALAGDSRFETRRLHTAATVLLGGAAIFGLSLQALVLLDQPALGMVTPLGGLCLVAGWLLVASAGLRRNELA